MESEDTMMVAGLQNSIRSVRLSFVLWETTYFNSL